MWSQTLYSINISGSDLAYLGIHEIYKLPVCGDLLKLLLAGLRRANPCAGRTRDTVLHLLTILRP